MTKRSYTEAVLQGVQSAKAGKALHHDLSSSKVSVLPVLLSSLHRPHCISEKALIQLAGCWLCTGLW